MDNVASYTKLYDSRASVFEVDPDTKSSWIQKGKSAIPIAFLASIGDQQQQQQQPDQNHAAQSRRELKIIGTNETGETVLDAIILPETTFMKRAKKFGQWIDHTGTVYGLGFNSEAELTDFGDTFQKLQRQILSPTTTTTTNQPTPNNNSTTNINDQQQQQQQQQHQSLQTQRASSQIDKPAWYQHNLTTNNTSETNGRHGTSSGRASTASSTQQFSSNTLAHPGHQIKRQPLQAPSSRPVNGDSNLNNSANDSGTTGGLSNVTAYPRSHSLYGLQSGRVSLSNNSACKFTPDDQHSPGSQNADWQIRDQLKYENERLKQALEESSKNAGTWHNELVNLRYNNEKLTQALQESKAHVEQWERELLSLRDENKQLVLRVKALESVSDPEKANDYKKEVQQYKSYMEQVQDELRKKEGEIQDLQKSMEELELKRAYSSNGHHQNVEDVPTQKLDLINAKLEAKVNELVNVQREFSQLIDKLHH